MELKLVFVVVFASLVCMLIGSEAQCSQGSLQFVADFTQVSAIFRNYHLSLIVQTSRKGIGIIFGRLVWVLGTQL